MTKAWMALMVSAMLVGGGAAACGGDDEGSGGGGTGTGSGTAAGTGSGTASGTGSGTASGTGGSGTGSGTPSGMVDEVHGCTMAGADDMTGTGTVTLPAWTLGHNACIVVDAGTDVTWEGGFSAHPLAGGEFPDDDMNLISMSDQSGQSATVTFDTPGDYPYFCLVHGTNMAGVIYVQ